MIKSNNLSNFKQQKLQVSQNLQALQTNNLNNVKQQKRPQTNNLNNVKQQKIIQQISDDDDEDIKQIKILPTLTDPDMQVKDEDLNNILNEETDYNDNLETELLNQNLKTKEEIIPKKAIKTFFGVPMSSKLILILGVIVILLTIMIIWMVFKKNKTKNKTSINNNLLTSKNNLPLYNNLQNINRQNLLIPPNIKNNKEMNKEMNNRLGIIMI